MPFSSALGGIHQLLRIHHIHHIHTAVVVVVEALYNYKHNPVDCTEAAFSSEAVRTAAVPISLEVVVVVIVDVVRMIGDSFGFAVNYRFC